MPKLSWDETDSRYFSTGVDRGVLYLVDEMGVAWNGLVSVNETPSGADTISTFYDGSKFFSSRAPESFEGTIESYTYPREFGDFFGDSDFLTAQNHKTFGFSYRTMVANGSDGYDKRYLIHIVYNAQVAPLNRTNGTITASPTANLFQWAFSTIPMSIGNRMGSHLIIDTGVAAPAALAELEDILYGSDDSVSRLPNPQDVIDMFENAAILKIIDHGDGTWTAEGPDEAIKMLSSTMFEISWPSAVYIDSVTYEISSL